MNVHVKDGLACARSDIEHCPVPILDTALTCNMGCSELTAADDFGVFCGRLLQSADMLLGNDQHMRRRLRVDVFKSVDVLIFIDFFGRYLTSDDAAEQTISHDRSVTKLQILVNTTSPVELTEKGAS